ncbi:unnamed protein product [Rotaria sp. Silwood2]|nr:unnamed protein product [Rotaria sp. Silwood2]CAF2578981.1 unnamed protein product [Rotaria sp. Silwood2]CAF2826135.1 unnamed protein product [Rotaria sp. Silwood2]CAF2987183.1 unnamed protein product [Rotaria sp. Silwood2]CAF3905463.1 unnamed protein product [Rotaria sp. Silwood2]
MAELILAAGAAYLGWRAARRVRWAYNSALEEMYAEQQYDYYDEPYGYGSQGYNHYPSRSSGRHHRSGGHHSGRRSYRH